MGLIVTVSCISTELYNVPCSFIYIIPTIIRVEDSLRRRSARYIRPFLSFCCHPLKIFYLNSAAQAIHDSLEGPHSAMHLGLLPFSSSLSA